MSDDLSQDDGDSSWVPEEMTVLRLLLMMNNPIIMIMLETSV